MSQVLPLRLNVKGCSGAALPPPGPCSRECRCEETRTTLVASYRHTSKPQICPFKQWQDQQKGLFCLKIFNRAGGACSYLHDWKVVVQVGRTCSSPLLDRPLFENCWHHVIIPFLQQLFPIFSIFRCRAPFEVPHPIWGVRVWDKPCESVPEAYSGLWSPSPLYPMENSAAFPVFCWKQYQDEK